MDTESSSLTVLFDEDREVVYEAGDLESLEPAYCLSVHKSQGSEFPVVIMPVTPGPPMLLTRNLLYTALTRARSMVVLVGSEEVIRRMVENNHVARRYTALARRLSDAGGECMKEWVETVQHMIDWIETHLDQTRMLHDLSEEIGYSPWYCSVLFHDVTNMTIKSYAAGRRLARAAEEIRDTRERILDIAVKYGYSSQEALSRVFKEQYGCTPAVYRRNPVPIRLQVHKVVLLPDYSETERITKMETSRLFIKVEHIPAHKYLGIWEEKAANYGDFWNYHDEDDVCGFVTSMDKLAHPIVTAHTAGWKNANGKRIYFYGTGVPEDYSGPVPEGFELREIPAGDYLVFGYPSFDYMTENANVMNAVENLAWNYDPHSLGYEWNEDERPDYQRHCPEGLGYQVLRPVRKA